MNRHEITTFVLTAIIAGFLLGTPSHADTDFPYQPWIRVNVSSGANTVSATVNGPSRLNVLESTGTVVSFDSSHTYTFQYSAGQVRSTESGGRTTPGFSIICDDESGRIGLNDRSYRRIIRVIPWDSSLICVNVLPIEEYLIGVVPCEVPPDWPMETLKAQAVAARTYSMRAIQQYPDRPFDLYCTVADQVYNGAGRERERTTQACVDTTGEVCTFNRLPIIAYYHAASGGWTASGGDTFGRDFPYLRSVPSRDSSVNRWTYPVSRSNLESALRSAGKPVGTIQRVWVHRFSQEGRAEDVKIVHSGGVTLIGSIELRNALGAGNIQSTYFTIQGQQAPGIPDESSFNADIIPATANPLELYSSLHPQVYIPLPEPVIIGSNCVISAGGTTQTTGLTVLGASTITGYVNGYVWLARPVLVNDLHRSGIGESSPLIESTPNALPHADAVDDPGSDIGVPQNGAFTFVGHGCGHGVGLSQHGARILAESGWTYDNILQYFYTGIEIQRYW